MLRGCSKGATLFFPVNQVPCRNALAFRRSHQPQIVNTMWIDIANVRIKLGANEKKNVSSLTPNKPTVANPSNGRALDFCPPSKASPKHSWNLVSIKQAPSIKPRPSAKQVRLGRKTRGQGRQYHMQQASKAFSPQLLDTA